MMGLIKRIVFPKSIWITHVNCGSCNGCDSEILSMFSPTYDAESMGISYTGSPKHADVLVVTGFGNTKALEVLKNIYGQMPTPRMVIAVGSCACTGGIFSKRGENKNSIDNTINVDGYITGCSPAPDKIIQKILSVARRNNYAG